MGASHDFPSYMYVCECCAGGNSTADRRGGIYIADILSAAFRVQRASHARLLSCRRSCFGCPLTGPKPVSEPWIGYPNTRYLAHPCCVIVWCRSAPLTSILVFETIVELFLLCCWILGGLSTDYPRDAPVFSSILYFRFAR